MDTTATVWLGLTLACARCHSHKFDPIAQEEFYRFFALFNNVPEEGRAVKYGNSPPMIKAPTRAQRADAARSSRDAAGRARSTAGSGPRGRDRVRPRPRGKTSARHRAGDRLVARR